MEINKEDSSPLTIESYDAQSITIQGNRYTNSTIISNKEIIDNWLVNSITDLNPENIQSLLASNPEIIIFGHNQTEQQLPISIRSLLAKHRIGAESMSVGAACRTFNILLSENREVVFAAILSSATNETDT